MVLAPASTAGAVKIPVPTTPPITRPVADVSPSVRAFAARVTRRRNQAVPSATGVRSNAWRMIKYGLKREAFDPCRKTTSVRTQTSMTHPGVHLSPRD